MTICQFFDFLNFGAKYICREDLFLKGLTEYSVKIKNKIKMNREF